MSAIKVGDRVRVLKGCMSAPVGKEFIVNDIKFPSFVTTPSLGTWYALGKGAESGVWGVYLEKIKTTEDLLAEIEELQAQIADLEAQLGKPAPSTRLIIDLGTATLTRLQDAITNSLVEAAVWQGRN